MAQMQYAGVVTGLKGIYRAPESLLLFLLFIHSKVRTVIQNVFMRDINHRARR